MSVQSSYPSRLPSTVQVEILDEIVTARVIDTHLTATASTGPEDMLIVEHGGSRYRVAATEADFVRL